MDIQNVSTKEEIDKLSNSIGFSNKPIVYRRRIITEKIEPIIKFNIVNRNNRIYRDNIEFSEKTYLCIKPPESSIVSLDKVIGIAYLFKNKNGLYLKSYELLDVPDKKIALMLIENGFYWTVAGTGSINVSDIQYNRVADLLHWKKRIEIITNYDLICLFLEQHSSFENI